MTTLMWKQYKKTAPFMQAGIFITCAIAFFATGRQWVPVLAFFLVMQLAALLGALWGYSIQVRKQRATARRDNLPLRRD